MKAQEIFDKAVGGLLAQGVRSYDDGTCLYRGPDGNKCAVGHLIPEDIDIEDIEGNGVEVLLSERPTLKHLFLASDRSQQEGMALLEDLQRIHDGFLASHWKSAFKDLAEEYKLQWNFN